MKKNLSVLMLLAGMLLLPDLASAKGIPIVYSNGQKITVAQSLPDSVQINGEHVNFAVSFNQFAIFWIPMWNYGETKPVLLTDSKTTYYDIEEEDATYLEQFGIDAGKTPKIPFWDRIGGKLIWGPLVLLILWGILPSRKKKEEPRHEEVAAQ